MRFFVSILLAAIATGFAMQIVQTDLSRVTAGLVVFVVTFGAIMTALLMQPVLNTGHTRKKTERRDKFPIGYGRALLDRVPVALFVISTQGRFVYVNPAAKDMIPRIRLNDHYAAAIRAPEFIDRVNAAVELGGEREVEFSAPGQNRVFSALIARLDNSDLFGQEAGVIVRLDDVTQMHRDVQARSDFIANASHELRTPLASLIGYIETLQGHAKDDPAAQERFLGIMANQAGRMRRLVDDLMSLSRIEMQEGIEPEGTVDIIDLFEESCAALSPVAEKAGVTVNVLAATGPNLVKGDRDQLLQVAINLLENAIKYGGAGAHVSVAHKALGNGIEITVTDDGPGIERQHLMRLTERFYRVNSGTAAKVSGTGLGLAIVKHIINRHRGKFSISSEIGVGSEFVVWLPFEQTKDAKPDAPTSRHAA